MKSFSAVCALVLSAAVMAAAPDGPYDEAADARADIRQALSAAAASKSSVVVVFGANWCADCRMLDTAMKTGSSAALFARDFKVVKVDVARFNKNVDVAESYGVPLKKGIPAVLILSPDNAVVYATRGGELADARQMGESGILQFFRQVTAGPRPKS